MGELLDTEVRALGPRPGVSIAIDVDCRDLM
jgi:hypothetical protein